MRIKEFLETNPSPMEQGYVFVLLPEKTKGIYEGYVKKAADSLSLRCESFLDLKGPGDALGDILTRIQRAEILIFDITDFTPNVMWELGLALALKNAESIIVIREERDASLLFNIYSHRVSFVYDPNSEDSLNELRETLINVMRGIKRSGNRRQPIQSPEVKSLLENALNNIKDKEWLAAEALFTTMDVREPENWYILNQWGIMLRTKDEFDAAISKFNQALKHAEYEEEKAYIYTELAVLYQKSRRHLEADEWFRRAEKIDSKNNHLYIAWAEFHDELGDYFSAQMKINTILAQLRESDPEYQEFLLRHAYYDQKIKNRAFRKTFDQFLEEKRSQKPRPSSRPRMQTQESNGNRLHYDIAWEDLVNKYQGVVVEGEINNVTELGLFVTLSRDFTGLVFWRNLKEGYEKRFSKGQPIKVRIRSAFPDPKDDRRKRIDLQLIDNDSRIIRPIIDNDSRIIRPKPVLLGASAPQAVRPRDSFAVRFLAYIKKLEKDIEAQVTKLSPSSQTHLALREARWQIGTRVKVHLSSPYLIILSPEEEFIWQGAKQVIDFNVQAPSDITNIKTVLRFDVSIGGISIAKIILDIEVRPDAVEEEPEPVITQPASTAFASYSSKDRLRVLDRVTEVERSGLNVFMDCLSFRPGEEWKAKVEQEIKSRDLFLLFWSANAKTSKWVEWEWKTALRERGKSGIEPHPLDPISEAEPPDELKDLHFGDRYMLIRKVYEATKLE